MVIVIIGIICGYVIMMPCIRLALILRDLKVDPPIMQAYIKFVYQLISSRGRWFTHMYLLVLMFPITQVLHNVLQYDIITLILDCFEGNPIGDLATNGTRTVSYTHLTLPTICSV